MCTKTSTDKWQLWQVSSWATFYLDRIYCMEVNYWMLRLETHLSSNHFVMREWSSCLMKLYDHELNKPGIFFKIDIEWISSIPELSTSQEEMDTWLFCMLSSYCSLMTLMTLRRDWKHLHKMWMSSNTNCSKQRKETWNLVNFLHVQVSNIFMTCMLISLVWKKKPGEISQSQSLKPGYCGVMESDQLSIHWLQGPPDLEIMVEFIACKCSKICKLRSCQCLMNSFKCQLHKHTKTWIKVTKMLLHLEWRGWKITLKIPIQNEMLTCLGSIVSISYSYKVITCT